MRERIPFDSCPLCESSKTEIFHIGNCSAHDLYVGGLSAEIQWVRCLGCGHTFTSGYYSDEALQLIFSKAHEFQTPGFSIEQHRPIAARMIEKVLPIVDTGTWLDIGFGNGALLLTAQEFGFRAVGTELRAPHVEMMRALGVEAHCSMIQDLQLREPCDVISMADVLEHIPFPRTALSAAHRLLKPDGVLLLSMPNCESPIWEALDRAGENPYWGELEHYHNFGRSRLYSLLRECGFEPRRYGISERYRACMEVLATRG